LLLLRVSQTNDIRNLVTLCDECHKILESKAINLLKHGGHRSDVIRMSYRWLAEQKANRFKLLEEEMKGENNEQRSE
jgi:hypothetical protein